MFYEYNAICFCGAVFLTNVWFRQENCKASFSPLAFQTRITVKFHFIRKLSTGKETDFTVTMNIIFMMRNDVIKLLLSIPVWRDHEPLCCLPIVYFVYMLFFLYHSLIHYYVISLSYILCIIFIASKIMSFQG